MTPNESVLLVSFHLVVARLADVQQAVPGTVKLLMTACGRVIRKSHDPSELFTAAFRKAQNRTVAKVKPSKARKHVYGVIRRCNAVRKHLQKTENPRHAVMALRQHLGTLTKKKSAAQFDPIQPCANVRAPFPRRAPKEAS